VGPVAGLHVLEKIKSLASTGIRTPDRSARYNLCVAFKSIVITVEFLASH
jgi:hypothetical protein